MKCRLTSALGAALLLFSTSSAFAVETAGQEVLQVAREGDLELPCASLSHEAAQMQDIITSMEASQNEAKLQEHGISAAGAVGSLLIGTVTGGLGLAAAGFLANEAVESNAEDAQSVKEIATQRRALMVGIYRAKGCAGPIEHVMRHETVAVRKPAPSVEAIEPAAGNADEPRTYFNE